MVKVITECLHHFKKNLQTIVYSLHFHKHFILSCYIIIVSHFCSSDKSMSPYNYYLCRSDKQTRERHLLKAHGGMKINLIQFVDDTAPMAAEALNAYRSACLTKMEIPKEVINSSNDGCLSEIQKEKEKATKAV